MSGGGGGGYFNDDWRRASVNAEIEDDKCDITERTNLNSPVPQVIATLIVGEFLLVDLETQPRERVVVKNSAQEIAGAITSLNLVKFIECIKKGSKYKAEVLFVDGGHVEVEIRPVNEFD